MREQLMVGQLVLPYIVICNFGKGLRRDDVIINLNLQKYEVAENDEINRVLSKYSKNKRLFDGDLVRLNNAIYDRSHGKLYLELQRTSYFQFLYSKEVIKSNYPYNPEKLANPIGVDVGVITLDNKIVLMKRSEKLNQYPSLYGITAGFMIPEDNTPYETAIREIKEEINLDDEKIRESIRLIEIGRCMDDHRYEILMTAKTNTSSEDIIRYKEKAIDKEGHVFVMDINPRSLAKYLSQTIHDIPPNIPNESVWIPKKSPAWVPAHWRVVYLILSENYGEKEVIKEIMRCVS